MRFSQLGLALVVAGCQDFTITHRIEQDEPLVGTVTVAIDDGHESPSTTQPAAEPSNLFEVFEAVLAGPPGTNDVLFASLDARDLTGSSTWQVSRVSDSLCVTMGQADLCSVGDPTGDVAVWQWTQVIGDSVELWEIEIDGPTGTVSIYRPNTEYLATQDTWNGAVVVSDTLTPPELGDGLAALAIDMGTRDGDCSWVDTAKDYFTAYVCVQTAEPGRLFGPVHAAWQNTCVDNPPECL